MTSSRVGWARPTSWFFGALLALALLGLALSATGDDHHGFVHAQPWDVAQLWAPLAGMSVLGALTAWRRWRILTILVGVLTVPVVGFVALVGTFLGPGRGEPIVSPTGRWAFRIDNHGFQDPCYAPVLLERHGVSARYWEAGERFWPDTTTAPKEVFRAPRWTSDDTVEVRSNRRVLTYRMTPDGPATVSTER